VVKVISLLLVILGLTLIAIGVFFDFVGALGLLRLPNFYTRLHAATAGAIGGAVVPMLGASLLALGAEYLGPQRFFLAGAAFASSILLMILAQAGSHALARATYISQGAPLEPIEYDALRERGRGGS
jgi:multicomponent Na+:H+ antiporter subunit G